MKCGRCQASFLLPPSASLGAKGRRLSCGVCSHSWFQSPDKLLALRDGYELVPFPEKDVELVKRNVEMGRQPDFRGEGKVYVGNLAFEATEEALAEHFAKGGEVGEVSIVSGPDGRSRGFAFVTMVTKEGGQKALELSGEDFMGRPLAVRDPNDNAR